jgi:hypothetical protein
MCSANDDPTTYDMPAQLVCQRRIWTRGVDRPCGAPKGLTVWTDVMGKRHAACRHHVAEMQHRYPTGEVLVPA